MQSGVNLLLHNNMNELDVLLDDMASLQRQLDNINKKIALVKDGFSYVVYFHHRFNPQKVTRNNAYTAEKLVNDRHFPDDGVWVDLYTTNPNATINLEGPDDDRLHIFNTEEELLIAVAALKGIEY